MSEANELFVVTASYTDDGAPAYLTASGTWSRSLTEAETMEADKRDALVAQRSAEDQRAVCDPYGFPVRVVDGAVNAVTKREEIRAAGPTTRIRRPD